MGSNSFESTSSTGALVGLCSKYVFDYAGKFIVKNNTLTLAAPVATALSPPGTSPRPLGCHGAALWNAITSSYDISDEGGREILAQACAALDRAEALRAQIDADGEILRTKAGLRDHPGLRHELASRAFITRSLARLGLDVEAINR